MCACVRVVDRDRERRETQYTHIHNQLILSLCVYVGICVGGCVRYGKTQVYRDKQIHTQTHTMIMAQRAFVSSISLSLI